MTTTTPRRPRTMKLRGLALMMAALPALPAAFAVAEMAGCAPAPVTVPTRSLERSGRLSFVCLGPPGSSHEIRPITDCSIQQVSEISDYGDPDAGPDSGLIVPHLYALVTQTTRGEVAVVDTSARNNPVLDEDPSVPGANFLPIGAQPDAILSTKGGVATYVGVTEIGKPGIFVLPSKRIRPASSKAVDVTVDNDAGAGGQGGQGGQDTVVSAKDVQNLSSWPACALPSRPADMIIITDPAKGGQVRATCDSAYGAPPPAGDNGDLGVEGEGRQKLVVAMPELGGVAIFDAQALLDQKPGAFEACPIERWVPLSVDLTPVPLPPPPTGPACAPPSSKTPDYAAQYTPQPTSLAYAAGKLYVSDLNAPVIHVLDMPTPCEPVELLPLLPTSAETPERIVKTTRIAVMDQATPDFERFLYAVDVDDASVMIFDVSEGSTNRSPLVRPHPEWNPLAARDRVKFAAAPVDLMIIQRDVPATIEGTGVAPAGLRCDPNPALKLCESGVEVCDPATAYRTTPAYDLGAGPLKLRGVFAFAALSSGRIAVIDIDDFDADCRGPFFRSPDLGCGLMGNPPGTIPSGEDFAPSIQACGTNASEQYYWCTSEELSCNVVLPHTPRSSAYEAPNATTSAAATANVAPRVPGLLNFPKLVAEDGTPIVPDDPKSPRMVAAVPPYFLDSSVPDANKRLQVYITSTLYTVGTTGTLTNDNGTASNDHVLAVSYEDPRAHVIDQNWSITFEGLLPGFDGKYGTFDTETNTLIDASSRFCDSGVQSSSALIDEGLADDFHRANLADYVQIRSGVPLEDDVYWGTQDLTCDFAVCIGTFGPFDTPLTGRDFRIVEAYQDRVTLELRDAGGTAQERAQATRARLELAKCCMPGAMAFGVRGGDQWVMNGDVNGFLHHVIPRESDGACRNSCDPVLSRKNGRIRRSPFGATVLDTSPNALVTPMYRFAILDRDLPDDFNEDPEEPDYEQKRDTATRPPLNAQFQMTGSGSFTPLLIALSTDGTQLIAPQGMAYSIPTGELAITDGALNGLIMVNLANAAFSRQFF